MWWGTSGGRRNSPALSIPGLTGTLTPAVSASGAVQLPAQSTTIGLSTSPRSVEAPTTESPRTLIEVTRLSSPARTPSSRDRAMRLVTVSEPMA